MKKQLLSGLSISPGVISGRVNVLKSHTESAGVQPGEIVVVPNSHPNFALAVMKAGGLICEVGGRLSHLCIVAMEMGIPCITQAQDARKILGDKLDITLDANEGIVYEL